MSDETIPQQAGVPVEEGAGPDDTVSVYDSGSQSYKPVDAAPLGDKTTSYLSGAAKAFNRFGSGGISGAMLSGATNLYEEHFGGKSRYDPTRPLTHVATVEHVMDASVRRNPLTARVGGLVGGAAAIMGSGALGGGAAAGAGAANVARAGIIASTARGAAHAAVENVVIGAADRALDEAWAQDRKGGPMDAGAVYSASIAHGDMSEIGKDAALGAGLGAIGGFLGSLVNKVGKAAKTAGAARDIDAIGTSARDAEEMYRSTGQRPSDILANAPKRADELRSQGLSSNQVYEQMVREKADGFHPVFDSAEAKVGDVVSRVEERARAVEDAAKENVAQTHQQAHDELMRQYEDASLPVSDELLNAKNAHDATRAKYDAIEETFGPAEQAIREQHARTLADIEAAGTEGAEVIKTKKRTSRKSQAVDESAAAIKEGSLEAAAAEKRAAHKAAQDALQQHEAATRAAYESEVASMKAKLDELKRAASDKLAAAEEKAEFHEEYRKMTPEEKAQIRADSHGAYAGLERYRYLFQEARQAYKRSQEFAKTIPEFEKSDAFKNSRGDYERIKSDIHHNSRASIRADEALERAKTAREIAAELLKKKPGSKAYEAAEKKLAEAKASAAEKANKALQEDLEELEARKAKHAADKVRDLEKTANKVADASSAHRKVDDQFAAKFGKLAADAAKKEQRASIGAAKSPEARQHNDILSAKAAIQHARDLIANIGKRGPDGYLHRPNVDAINQAAETLKLVQKNYGIDLSGEIAELYTHRGEYAYAHAIENARVQREASGEHDWNASRMVGAGLGYAVGGKMGHPYLGARFGAAIGGNHVSNGALPKIGEGVLTKLGKVAESMAGVESLKTAGMYTAEKFVLRHVVPGIHSSPHPAVSPDDHDKVNELADQARQAAADPQAALNMAEKLSNGQSDSASLEIGKRSAATLQNIAKWAPEAAVPLSALGGEPAISTSQANDFVRYAQSTVDPASAMDTIASGMANPVVVQSLMDNHPELLDEIRASLVANMPNLAYAPQQSLQHAAVLFGSPLTANQRPEYVQVFQRAWDQSNRTNQESGAGGGSQAANPQAYGSMKVLGKTTETRNEERSIG